MGRSQVQRNRARGRPGTRGRGGGGSGGRNGSSSKNSGTGRGGGPTQPHPKELGSNAWRYEARTADDADRDDDTFGGGFDDDGGFMTGDDLDGMWDQTGAAPGYGEHGPAHHEASAGMGGGVTDTEQSSWRGGGRSRALDVSAMANVLRNLPTSDRLGMPDHVASVFDSRYGNGSRRGKSKTVSEMRAEADNDEPESFLTMNDERGGEDAAVKNASSSGRGSEGSSSSADVQDSGVGRGDGKDGEEGEEEEDLDAWLDSVIS